MADTVDVKETEVGQKAPAEKAPDAPLNLESAVHTALDRSEKALAKAERLERLQAERDAPLLVLAAPVSDADKAERRETRWAQFVAGLTGDFDDGDADA